MRELSEGEKTRSNNTTNTISCTFVVSSFAFLSFFARSIICVLARSAAVATSEPPSSVTIGKIEGMKPSYTRQRSMSANNTDSLLLTRDGKFSLSPVNEINRSPSFLLEDDDSGSVHLLQHKKTTSSRMAPPPTTLTPPLPARKRFTSDDMMKMGVSMRSPVRARTLTRESSNSADFNPLDRADDGDLSVSSPHCSDGTADVAEDEREKDKRRFVTRFRTLKLTNWLLYPIRALLKPVQGCASLVRQVR